MACERRVAGIIDIAVWFQNAHPRAVQRRRGGRCLSVGDGLAIVHADRGHVAMIEHFLLVVADDDQSIEFRGGDIVAQAGDRRLHVGMTLPQHLGVDARCGILRRAFQQIAIAARIAVEIDELARTVAAEERLVYPILDLARQHRTVRGSKSRHQLCHEPLRRMIGSTRTSAGWMKGNTRTGAGWAAPRGRGPNAVQRIGENAAGITIAFTWLTTVPGGLPGGHAPAARALSRTSKR